MRARPPLTPASVILRELVAAQGRRLRGTLAPGERFPTGMRPSRRRAQGVDLDSIGPYVVGDDLRFMDWRATARTGRAQMKRFIAESHLARILVIDFRPPMGFATAEHPMAKTAALLAARLAWEAFNLHEPIGLFTVPEDDVIEPRRGRGQVIRILGRLVDSYAVIGGKPAPGDDDAAENKPGEDVLALAVDRAAAELRRGDEITILSDFGGSLEPLAAVARKLAGHRVVRAVVIEDAIYDQPVPAGRYPVRVTHEVARASAVVTRAGAVRHGQAAEEIRGDLRRALGQAGIQVVEVAGAAFLAEGGRR